MKQEVAPAVEATGAPAQSVVSRLAGATPGALGCAGAGVASLTLTTTSLMTTLLLPEWTSPLHSSA